jgi:hypothetical protein
MRVFRFEPEYISLKEYNSWKLLDHMTKVLDMNLNLQNLCT